MFETSEERAGRGERFHAHIQGMEMRCCHHQSHPAALGPSGGCHRVTSLGLLLGAADKAAEAETGMGMGRGSPPSPPLPPGSQ